MRPLSEKQRQILQDLADGDSYEEVATTNFIALGSVYQTVHRIRLKMKARTTSEAVANGIRNGVIT